MSKSTSLYSNGFRPFAFSLKLHQEKGIEWQPVGTNIVYKRSNLVRKKGYLDQQAQESVNYYYTLEWKYTYEYPDDEVFFAQFPPYTYSDLLKHIKTIKDYAECKNIVKMNELCKTLGNNSCPMLTITEKVDTYLSYEQERMLSAKSLSSKRMIMNKVEKLRSDLKRKQNVAKILSKRPTIETAEGSETASTIESTKLESFIDSQCMKDHELEGKYIFISI